MGAFDDYSALQTQVIRRTRRTDLAALLPQFIQLAETTINRVLKLERATVDSPLTGTIGSRFIALPDDFISPVTLWQEWPWGREERRFVPASAMETTIGSSFPDFWTVDGANIAFERELDQAYSYTLRNVQGLALSDAQPTNWLLTNHPDVYFHGTLLEAFLDTENDAQAGVAKSRFDAGLAEVDLLALRTRTLATLSVDPALRVRSGGFNIYRGE